MSEEFRLSGVRIPFVLVSPRLLESKPEGIVLRPPKDTDRISDVAVLSHKYLRMQVHHGLSRGHGIFGVVMGTLEV